MDKIKKLIEKNPKLKSDKSEYLRLAIKDEKGVVRGTGPHKVKLIDCENAVNRDYKTERLIKGVNLIFDEAGERKKYFVPILGEDGKFHYLIQRFAEIDEGAELVLEYKRREGSPRGFIEVVETGKQKVAEAQQGDYDDIPVVEEEEYGTPEEDFGAGYRPEMEGEERV